MQELSRFSGIVIVMNGNKKDDPQKPRIGVCYGEFKAELSAEGNVLSGNLPFDQLMILTGWLRFYKEDIYRNWEHEIKGEYVDKVPQLKRSRVTIKNDVFPEGLTLQDVLPLDCGIILVTFSDGQRRLFDTISLEEAKYISLRDPNVFKNVKVENGLLSCKNGELEISAETVYKFSSEYKN